MLTTAFALSKIDTNRSQCQGQLRGIVGKRDIGLFVRMFGRLIVTVRGEEVELSPKLASIFCYIARHKWSKISRDRVASLYWNDIDNCQSRRNLRVALWRIRKVLCNAGVAFVEYSKTRDEVSFCTHTADVYVDANTFEDITTSLGRERQLCDYELEELCDCLELYSNEFLPGFDELWVVTERERLNGLYKSAVRRVCIEYVKRGNTKVASGWVQRLLELDSGDEKAAVLAMTLAAHRGYRADAVEIYRKLVHDLRHEFGLAPSEVTECEFQRITLDAGKASQALDVEKLEKELFT